MSFISLHFAETEKRWSLCAPKRGRGLVGLGRGHKGIVEAEIGGLCGSQGDLVFFTSMLENIALPLLTLAVFLILFKILMTLD